MNAEQYSGERSALDKKLEPWEGALVHGQQYYGHHQHQQEAAPPSQDSAYHHHQHFNPEIQPGQLQQSAYFQHHATMAAQAADALLFQPMDASRAGGFGSPNSTTSFHVSATIHNKQSFTMGHNIIPPQAQTTKNTSLPAPLNLKSPPTSSDQFRTRPPLVSMTPPPHTPIRDHTRHHKGSTLMVSGLQHRPEKSEGAPAGRVSKLAMVKSSCPHTGRRVRSTAMSAFTVRPTGTKDRHSKVRTAKGLRDRRVRLSAPTAIQFFDVQDRLGYDQPSKAVDWLIEKAKGAIDELAPIQGMMIANESTGAMAPASPSRDGNHSSAQVKDEESQHHSISSGAVPISDPRAESRAKARERARERAKEKSTTSSPIPAAASTTIATTISSFPLTPPFSSSPPPNIHLLPEFLLLTSQFCQIPPPPNDHNLQRPLIQPQDHLSIFPSPASANSVATHLLPFASHFFPTQFTGPASCFGDMPPSMQISAPQILYSNMNTTNNITPISPRGTLQSIFSNPSSSHAQAHMMPQLPPIMMMGSLHAHAYGAAPLGGSMGGCMTSEAGDQQQSSSHELGSPDLHQNARIPMRIHGMELGSQEESRITNPSYMEAEL